MKKPILDLQTCARCGGHCCNYMPGIYHPDQFTDGEMSFDSDRHCIDWWEGDPEGGDRDRVYYIRARSKLDEGVATPAWGGFGCLLVNENGCTLPLDERPYQCLQLVPQPDFKCDTLQDETADKRGMAIAWMPYQDWLEALLQSYGEEPNGLDCLMTMFQARFGQL